jgi:hypothetical protein
MVTKPSGERKVNPSLPAERQARSGRGCLVKNEVVRIWAPAKHRIAAQEVGTTNFRRGANDRSIGGRTGVLPLAGRIGTARAGSMPNGCRLFHDGRSANGYGDPRRESAGGRGFFAIAECNGDRNGGGNSQGQDPRIRQPVAQSSLTTNDLTAGYHECGLPSGRRSGAGSPETDILHPLAGNHLVNAAVETAERELALLVGGRRGEDLMLLAHHDARRGLRPTLPVDDLPRESAPLGQGNIGDVGHRADGHCCRLGLRRTLRRRLGQHAAFWDQRSDQSQKDGRASHPIASFHTWFSFFTEIDIRVGRCRGRPML